MIVHLRHGRAAASAASVALFIGAAGCGTATTAHRSATQTPHTATTSTYRPGPLSGPEKALAATLGQRKQAQVTGTFIGATAFTTHGTPFDPGSDCDLPRRLLDIRLVWKSDANFVHGGIMGGPPDGPRKDLLLVVDPATQQVCETLAGYSQVGADPGETLLYGEWPDKADG